MAKSLVIVESPAKAKKIGNILGSDFVVDSSIGHIRDLPRNAAEIPAKYKGEKWARMGVNVENGFEPIYVVPKDKKAQVTKLKKLLKDSDQLYLATDKDREGEAIAWHLLEVLKPKVEVKRMVFNEITEDAILNALQNSGQLDQNLVEAQETRRILDRLVGYEVSPVLWKMVRPKLSAGRVQSPAVRIVVQRERERIAFVSASYFSIDAVFETEDKEMFDARLLTIDEKKIATGKDFNSEGELASKKVALLDEEAARDLQQKLTGQAFTVTDVDRKPYTRKPKAPFRTSTLQQDALRSLRFSSSRTMSAAQRLYENGFITYMRTDSTTLSESALTAARNQVAGLYGNEYLPDAPRTYGTAKGAQEAHEAIRPAGDSFQMPTDVAKQVNSDEAKLYELIWKRTIASQMADAKGERLAVRIAGDSTDGRATVFGASGLTITFPGFMRAYVEGSDNPEAELDDKEKHLPAMAEDDDLTAVKIDAVGHDTKPPARYNEASLIERLEELGIGRPSTYASIISTIQDRGYVWKRGAALIPSFTAFATVGLLEEHFSDLVDYEFTARMEADLDDIAAGETESRPWLRKFYLGNGSPGLARMVIDRLGEIDARQVNSFPIGEDGDGQLVEARAGRYGPFLSRGDDTAPIPDDIAPDELTLDVALELLSRPSGDKILGTDPESGLTVIAKNGRFGPYVQLGDADPADKKNKPKTASLFKTMEVDSLSLDQALQLLTLPRVVGVHPETGEEIHALNGRYGPYLKMGSDSRSLETEEELFTIAIPEALEVFAQPKRRRGQSARGPLKELGADPDTKKPIVLKEGRFGPYVTDGETNASLRKGDTIENVTPERAQELLAERRAKLANT